MSDNFKFDPFEASGNILGDIAKASAQRTKRPETDAEVRQAMSHPEIECTDEYEAAYRSVMVDLRPTFITGGAGVGKSTFLRDILIPAIQRRGWNMAITGMTGLAGSALDGRTLHSWLGIGLGPTYAGVVPQALPYSQRLRYYENAYSDWDQRMARYGGFKQATLSRLRAAETLIIDEVSMLAGCALLDYMDFMLRKVRDNPQPFGGLLVVFCGDFCLQKGTQVVMSDGSLRNVEDVRVGDQVMGPDSKPRNVLRLFAGEAPLYRVTQSKADSYVTTGNHRIVLRRRGNSGRFKEYGDQLVMTARELSERPAKFLEVFGGFRAGVVQMPERKLSEDAYEAARRVAMCGDPEATLGEDLVLNSEAQRLHALAGVLDAVGLRESRGYMLQRPSATPLMRQVKHLADLLGFRTRLMRYRASTRLTIGGDIWRIPSRTRSIPTYRDSQSCPYRSSTITVTQIEDGEFAGFETDGDHMFLLADGTVTHNCQLPPVEKHSSLSAPARPDWAFLSTVWEEAKVNTIEFTKVFRQADAQFVNFLNRRRLGEPVSAEEWGYAQRFFRSSDQPPPIEELVRSTHLMPTNAQADETNRAALAYFPGPGWKFNMIYEVHEYQLDRLRDSHSNYRKLSNEAVIADVKKRLTQVSNLRETLELRVGMPVLITYNDPGGKFVNGSRAIVSHYDEGTDTLLVTLQARYGAPEGETIELKRSLRGLGSDTNLAMRHIHIDDDGKTRDLGPLHPYVAQFPVIPGVAITIHKAQGASLESAVIDLNRSFAPGHVYVALSRLRSPEGLTLLSHKIEHVSNIVDPSVLQFYMFHRQQRAANNV